jgi:ubiquinone/menaquinone biosynthesis C-methylase UbiE
MTMTKEIVWPPADLLMQISNSASLDDFKASFPEVRSVLGEYAGLAGKKLSNFDRILDFGCGPGRFLYAMQPHLRKGQELHGCDVNEACATWARDNIDFAKVIHSHIEPPLPYPDNHFDFIYACSVFTHLSLDLQFKWSFELQRILKPGGIAILTTSSPTFMTRSFAAMHLFQHSSAHALNDGDMIAVLATSGSEIEGQREVATIHTLGAARSVFAGFDMVKQVPMSLLAGGQTVNLLRKSRQVKPLSIEPVEGVYRTATGLSDVLSFDTPQRKGVLKFALSWDAENYIGRFMKWTHNGGETRFPINAALGKDHLAEFSIPITEATTRLQIATDHKNLLPQDAGFKLRFVRVEI